MKYLLLVFLGLFSKLTAQNTINATLDLGYPKEINPLLYGYNQDHEDVGGDNNWGSRRLGGNRLTVFNWENGASNSGHDNTTYPNDNRIASLVGVPWNDRNKAGEAYRFFHQENLDAGVESIITLPILGYVAADKNGSNLTNPPSARWDELVYEKGSAFTLTPDLSDGKVFLDESFNYLLQTFGNSTTANGIKYIALDNEPALWDNTHPNVQTAPPTIQEYLDKLIASAKVIKAMDPNVKIIVGEFAGINIYDFSNANDWSTLGNGYDWFPSLLLDKLKQESDAFGKPLVDVISFHFYPQHKVDASGNFSSSGTVVRTSSSTTERMRETRMDFTRSLWDSTYTEPSWLTNSKLGGESNIILHRLQNSIDQYFPGVEIMIGEFDYGNDTDVSHGLATIDYLGAGSQYGIGISNRWDLNPYNGATYTNAAYKLFRNYDGSNSAYGSKAVHSNFDARGDGSVWASLSDDESQLHLIVINKDVNEILNFSINTGELDYEYNVSGVYEVNSSSSNITSAALSEVNISGTTFSGDLAALSAYHVVLNRNQVLSECDISPTGIGGFEGALYNEWNYFDNPGSGSLGNFSQESTTTHSGSSSLKVDVSTAHPWGMRFFNKCDLMLVNENLYTVDFWVYGGNGKQVKVALQDGSVIEQTTVNLTSNGWEQYQVVFQSDGDYANGKIKFTFPEVGVYYIDDIQVTESVPAPALTIQPDHTNLRYNGAVYTDITSSSVTFYRFPYDYARNSESIAGTNVKNASRAAASSGINIEFKTSSANIKAMFRENAEITGGLAALSFAVYKNGAFYDVFTQYTDDVEFTFGDNSGETNTWKITMPSFAQVDFLGLEIDATSSLEVLPTDDRPVYVAIGNSITHGMGQTNLSTHLTYPWLVSDSLDYHLFNWGIGSSKINESVFDNFADANITPDVVSVLWGYNDFNCGLSPCNTDDYIINNTMVYYTNLMSELATTFPNADIVGILPTYSNTTDYSSVRSLDYLRTEQAAVIENLQLTHENITFFNGNDVTDVGSLSDDVHLNDLGAEQVAYRLIRHLQTPNEEPTVSLSVSPQNPELGDVVTISWTTDDADGIIRSTVVSLNGIEQQWTSGQEWTAVAGTNTISITVTDNRGISTTEEVEVVVEDEMTSLPTKGSSAMGIYPNPAYDFVYLSGIDKGTGYEIFTTKGEFIRGGSYSSEGINVASLSEGVYILKVNGKSLKLLVK